jgi:hypothetical protein
MNPIRLRGLYLQRLMIKITSDPPLPKLTLPLR